MMTDNFDPNSLIWIDQRDCQKWALAVYLRGKHAILALPTVVVRRVPNPTPCKLPINVRGFSTSHHWHRPDGEVRTSLVKLMSVCSQRIRDAGLL